jgi:ubiquitin
MKRSSNSPASASMRCASRSVPSVDHQRLGFAAGEQRRAVGARQHAVADLDGAHGAGVAAVDARLAGQDLAAHDAGLDLEQQAFDLDACRTRRLRPSGGHHTA